MKKELYFILFTICAVSFSCNSSKQENKQISKLWIGSWDRNERQNGATLNITKILNDSLIFAINASSGGNTGGTEGKAAVSGNTAKFYSTEGSDTCLLIFTIMGDSLVAVTQEKGDCGCAMGVSLTGDYFNSKYKGKTAKNEKQEETLATLEILTKDEDAMFHALTGKDYDTFVATTQLTSEETDLDSLNCKVLTAGVRGLFHEMENIIMISPDHDIYAAVIDDQKVLYFTNDKEYLNKLPKTIEKWRSGFKEYPVIFKSTVKG